MYENLLHFSSTECETFKSATTGFFIIVQQKNLFWILVKFWNGYLVQKKKLSQLQFLKRTTGLCSFFVDDRWNCWELKSPSIREKNQVQKNLQFSLEIFPYNLLEMDIRVKDFLGMKVILELNSHMLITCTLWTVNVLQNERSPSNRI